MEGTTSGDPYANERRRGTTQPGRSRPIRPYPEAERAVDKLSDSDFPVGRVAIVGTGLKLVEQVAGRTTTGRCGAGRRSIPGR